MIATHVTPLLVLITSLIGMALRTGHGTGKGSPRIEVMPPDEQPDPVPGTPALVRRRSNGTLSDSESAKRIGARGGLARAHRARLVSSLGLQKLDANAAFAPYRVAGDAFVTQHLAQLARQAGGEVGPGPASIVVSAAVQLTASRFFSDQAMKKGDADLFKRASSLANDSRQNLLAAYELAVREAKAREEHSDDRDPWEEESE